MLEVFKQKKSFLTRDKEKSSFKYVISFDDIGAYIEIYDNKSKAIKNIDFRVYNGVDREILQFLEKAYSEDFFEISWENESGAIYLHKHPHLLNLLKLSDKFFLIDDNKNKQISFNDEIFITKFIISLENNSKKESEKLKVYPQINNENDFKFLNENHIISGSTITQISPIGDNFNTLSDFNTIIDIDSLEEILSVLMTHFHNIDIKYKDYDVFHKDEKKLIKPAIIFEKVTPSHELILQTSATIGKLSPVFFNDFNISKMVLIDDIEKSINIYECDFSNVFEIYGYVFKTLNTLKRKLNKEDKTNFSEEDGLFMIESTLASEFILQNLHHIMINSEVFGSDKLKSYKYNTTKPTLNVKFKDKIDFLEGDDVSITIGADTFNIFDMFSLYKKHSYIPLNNGEKSILDKSYIAKLERIFKKDGKKIKVSFFDLPEIEALITKKTEKVFVHARAFYEGFNKLKKSKTSMPPLQNVVLREYQKQGIKWLKYLYDNEFGGCLADDMGLGKTVQAISLLSFIYPKTKSPSLIIMPKSLLNNWQNELNKFNPNLSFYLYYANDRDIEKIEKYQIILSTYATIRNDIEKIRKINFDTIILDESQNIKNTDSKISKAIMLLEAKHKFALSGTPIENSLFELYSLFRFINNGMFSTIGSFKNDFVIPIQSDGNEQTAKILKAKISPFLLRRLKSDVLKDLPQKQEQIIYVDMDEDHKKFYNEKRDYYKQILDAQIGSNGIEKSRFVILQAFNDLRQIASAPQLKSDKPMKSSKIENMFEMLEDIVANKHKVLIFANFLGSLDLIANKADELSYEYLIMNGSTRDRQSLVDKFQNEDKYSLFLMTLKVGGVGLNLTKADYVFIFDPWWNKSAENQAVDRAHRIGQKNTVFSYKMITKDSIEEKILQLQSQKQDMSDMIISGDGSGLKKLSSSDLDYILG